MANSVPSSRNDTRAAPENQPVNKQRPCLASWLLRKAIGWLPWWQVTRKGEAQRALEGSAPLPRGFRCPPRAAVVPCFYLLRPSLRCVFGGLWLLFPCVSFSFYPASDLTHLTLKLRGAGKAEPIAQKRSPFRAGLWAGHPGVRCHPDPASAGPALQSHVTQTMPTCAGRTPP